jgi:malonyl CoA-acyl carrier protein transacylase
VEHATIQPTNQTKEEKMEETTVGTINDLLTPYNPDMLVTYKKISGYSDTEFLTDKVRNIEWELHNARTNSKAVSAIQNKISLVKDIITEAYADSLDQDTLREIAEALEIQLTREVEWSATIEVSGTFTVDLLEDVDADFESELYDNLYVESQNGNIEIVDTEVTNVREN